MNNIYKEICEKCCPYCDAECDGCWLEELINEELAEERKKVIERIRDLAEIYTEPSSKGFDFDTYILTEENLNNILDKAERGGYDN